MLDSFSFANSAEAVSEGQDIRCGVHLRHDETPGLVDLH